MKKVVGIGIVVVAVIVLIVTFLFYRGANSKELEVGDDEIALYIQFDTKEDIGLLVFDYNANGSEYSGGISNADKSLIKRDDRLIEVWNKEDLKCSDDMVELSIEFKIITEYVEPNYENIYPDNLIKSLEPISFKAQFGESYYFTITGDSISGYIIRTDGNGLDSIVIETEEISSEGNYPGADVVEIVNLRGDVTTVYKLADGTYMDRVEHRFIYNGTDTWMDENGVEWNEIVK